jgi:nucleoside-diphosphate-sugar epimerase
MRILVSGSSGHVGGAIAAHLMERGHEVVGLSRRLTKNNRLLSHAVAADIGTPGLAALIADKQGRCDAIVHAAAAIDYDPYAPAISMTNGVGTQQLLALAARWEVSSFVYVSSVPLIGRPLELPITEEHPVAPLSAYHASKLFGEHLCAIARAAGTPTISLRLTAPVGPGMAAGRILPVFVRRALAGEPLELAGEGTRGQDYVDARDVATAVEASLQMQPAGVLNIASGTCTTNHELANRCVEVLGSSSEVRLLGTPDPEEGVRWEVSIQRAEETIDYRPRHSLQDSITAVAEDLRTNLDRVSNR